MGMRFRSGDSAILMDIVLAELERSDDRDWQVQDLGFWRLVTSDGYPMPEQGWKLHLSATMLSAPVVLARVARVLMGEGCAFKFPARLDDYWELLTPHCDRAQAGKFITVYPRTEAESVRLAAILDEATMGLPGPLILSDRCYRAGGIVHYRYGAFTGHRTLGNEGFYEVRLRSPDGELLRDERLPRFTPPPFAVSPFGEPPQTRPATPEAVLLNDRFEVREAIRHGNRGGVYVALDAKTGREVIVREGRPHACADLSGADARTSVAAQCSALGALAGTQTVPAVVDFFEQGGHVFLVEELVQGITLERWWEANSVPIGRDGFGCRHDQVLPIVHRLVEKLTAVHRQGYVLGDLSPGNVMIRPDGDLRLIDLEFAAAPGAIVLVAGTPGFLAPELTPHRAELRPAPPQSADLYSLGAMVYFLAVGVPPAADRVRRVGLANSTLARLRPMVEGLLARPDERWSLDRCARFLQQAVPLPAEGAPPVTAGLDELIDDGLAWLTETMARDEDPAALWPDGSQGIEGDPCTAGNGAAGILMMLALGAPEAPETTATAGWLRRRLAEEEAWPPGLYMGRSGSLWALYEAARSERDFALHAARSLPTAHPSPDITHGLAGCAMAVLRLASRSGDPGLHEQAAVTFQNLHDARTYLGDRPQWPTALDFDSGLAGANHFGFAHGIAGIATALLYGSAALDRPDWLPVVHEVAATLIDHADLDGDAAWWPTVRAEPSQVRPRRPHWCSGSSGIGSFLIRYWRVTGDAVALSWAERAATAVHRSRWKLGPAACHGLPGEGDFLLDMAEFTGQDRYRGWAEDLAECLAAQAVRRSGRLLVPDPFGRFVPGYLGGAAGQLGFLLRLRDRHPRLWMLDDLTFPSMSPRPEGR